MINRLLAVVTIALFVAFTGIVIVYVKEPALMVVVMMGWAMAIYDFWTTIMREPDAETE